MADTVANARLVQGEGIGLADVVKEHGQAQGGVGSDVGHSVKGVLPDVIAVVGIPLLHVEHGGDLWQKDRQDVPMCPKHLCRTVTDKDALELGEDALLGDVVELLFAPMHGLSGLRLDGEPVPRPKAQRPQNAQAVLLKPLLRHAHTADEAAH